MTTVNLVNSFLSGGGLATRGVQVGAYSTASLSGGLFPAMPSDVQEGDLLIMRISSDSNALIDSATEFAGWQTIVSLTDGGFFVLSLAYVVVGPSLPATSATQAGTRMAANITRYRLPGTPTLVDFSGQVTTGPTGTATAPSITIPGDAGRVLVVAASQIKANDTTASTTFAAASMSASEPSGSFAAVDTALALPSGQWMAEGAGVGTRTGTSRSMHGFSVTDTSPPSATGAFSNVHALASTTAMVAAVFKY